MIRYGFQVTLAIVLVLGWAAAAQAKSFTVTKIILKNPDDGGTMQESELNEFFNLARCVCQTEVKAEFQLSIDNAGESQSVTVVAGEGDCLDSEGEIDRTQCTEPTGFPLSSMENATDDTIDATFRAHELMSDADCNEKDSDDITLAVFEEDAGDWKKLGAEVKYRRDIQPPNPPQLSTESSEPRGGEQSVTVTFQVAETSKEDTTHYQLLCVKMSEDGTKTDGAWGGTAQSPAFVTAQGLCNASSADDASSAEADDAEADQSADAEQASESSNATATEPSRPSGLLNSKTNPYVCSERLASDGSHTVKGLKNGQLYGFYVVAIDQAQNPSEPRWLGTGMAVNVEDFWEVYSRLGGKGDGGYGCALAPATDWAGSGMLLGLLTLLALCPRTRRTSRRRGGR